MGVFSGSVHSKRASQVALPKEELKSGVPGRVKSNEL